MQAFAAAKIDMNKTAQNVPTGTVLEVYSSTFKRSYVNNK